MQVVDMHCDTVVSIMNKRNNGETIGLKENSLNIDLTKMKKGNYLLQNFAIFTPFGKVESPEHHALQGIDMFYQLMEENQDLIKPVFSYKDIQTNIQNNTMSALLTLEEGGVVFNDLAVLRDYYRLGVRMICLTWNYANGIGHPNFTPGDDSRSDMLHTTNTVDGLTTFGKEYVKEMERLGIIVDVSHLGDKGFWDVVDITTKPFVASHSNARAICSVARNLTDDMIRALYQKGGVMGINFCDDFLSDDGNGTIAMMVKHIDHIKEVAGIEVIGMGTDFDGIAPRKELEDASKMPLLCTALHDAGYTSEQIDLIMGGNVLRVYKEVLK